MSAPEQQMPPQPGQPGQPGQPMDIDEHLKTGRWSHGLCGCFDNLSVCIIAYFVPCVTFGQTRQRLTGGGCVTYGLLYLIPFLNCYLESVQRGTIRDQRGIPGGMAGDCCTICWCSLCTLVQEEQEAIALEQERSALQGGGILPAGATVIVATGNLAGPQPTYPPQPYQVTAYNTAPPTYPAGAAYPPPGQAGYAAPPPQGYNPQYPPPDEMKKAPEMDRN